MSTSAYTVLHLLGAFLAFLTLGGLVLHTLNGGTKESNRGRRLTGITFGVGMLLVLISGFALLARGHYGFPLWVWLKVAVWLVVGALPAFIPRFPRCATFLWWLVPLLGALAAWLCLYKPSL